MDNSRSDLPNTRIHSTHTPSSPIRPLFQPVLPAPAMRARGLLDWLRQWTVVLPEAPREQLVDPMCGDFSGVLSGPEVIGLGKKASPLVSLLRALLISCAVLSVRSVYGSSS